MRPRLRLVAVIAVINIALAAVTTSGCAARRFDALMQSWRGQTIADLFRTWGRPAFLYSDDEGGQIAVYVPAASAGTPRPAAANGTRPTEPLRVYDPRMKDNWPVYRIFFIDTTGHIVRSQWRGRWECCSS